MYTFFFLEPFFSGQMVTVEESAPKASISTEPEGLSHILKQSVILDPQQVREVCTHSVVYCKLWKLKAKMIL